jgi:hypothetical protein
MLLVLSEEVRMIWFSRRIEKESLNPFDRGALRGKALESVVKFGQTAREDILDEMFRNEKIAQFVKRSIDGF